MSGKRDMADRHTIPGEIKSVPLKPKSVVSLGNASQREDWEAYNMNLQALLPPESFSLRRKLHKSRPASEDFVNIHPQDIPPALAPTLPVAVDATSAQPMQPRSASPLPSSNGHNRARSNAQLQSPPLEPTSFAANPIPTQVASSRASSAMGYYRRTGTRMFEGSIISPRRVPKRLPPPPREVLAPSVRSEKAVTHSRVFASRNRSREKAERPQTRASHRKASLSLPGVSSSKHPADTSAISGPRKIESRAGFSPVDDRRKAADRVTPAEKSAPGVRHSRKAEGVPLAASSRPKRPSERHTTRVVPSVGKSVARRAREPVASSNGRTFRSGERARDVDDKARQSSNHRRKDERGPRVVEPNISSHERRHFHEHSGSSHKKSATPADHTSKNPASNQTRTPEVSTRRSSGRP
ncbi:hypothetical protein FISHEDRAFT_60014 [Fistulina hepatica ATCC 64428]|uniref:Uncharacterized protein n=1 Tax=Fistulina hepatica ATCC 64428 TaxID=1128425 RepID=A0A0D7A7T3_9AGAR|nr:hypothetical protein FISHEDRAFT_60014 [Fistulina hepatica ATCC 64428]